MDNKLALILMIFINLHFIINSILIINWLCIKLIIHFLVILIIE